MNNLNQQEIAKEDLKALLVSVYLNSSQKGVCDEHLRELELLANTYGVKVLETVTCMIRKYDASTFITSGKLEELIATAKAVQANLIIFDDEIAPSQQRNLEAAFKLPVMDRTELILEVFAERAQTKEARLQIELAKVKYEAPRLKRLWTHLSRQQGTAGGGGSGGGGYLKGEGEKQIEIDRRLLKKRIELLNRDIQEVQATRSLQRSQREKTGIPTFAIIGYTNAGKSTLLNALTQAGVLMEDKLFATLDTTTRKFTLPNNQDILLIDTVGFIRKLPHLLVAAFKSTLEEAIQTDILLHLVDVSHPMAEEQAQTTFEVLKELNAENKPMITVLNKIDQQVDPIKIQRLKMLFPHTVEISALHHMGFDALQEQMVAELEKQRKKVKLRIPQSEYAIVSEVMRLGNVLKRDFDENDVIIWVDLPRPLASKLKNFEEI
ncbi:MAG: GTPase HflX [Parachlamydiaceae bacterium]